MKTAVLKYSELRALLYPVIPHAGTDDMLPVLCQIPITEHSGYLVAQATNRFTAAFKRVKPEKKPPKGFATAIEIHAAKKLLTLLRPIRGHDPAIELRADGDKIHVQTETSGFQFGFAHVGFTLDCVDTGPSVKFPDVGSLLPEDLAATVSEQAFNYDLLTTFKAALDGRARYERTLLIRMGATPNKPMLVTVTGDHLGDFVGMIMPRRTSGDGSIGAEHFPGVVTSWAETFGQAS